MAEFITATVEGLAELEANLNRLAEVVAKKLLRQVSRRAMNVMRTRIEANAPVGQEPLRSGRTIRLRDGIIMASKVQGEGVRGAAVIVLVGLRVRPADRWVGYGRYLEFGTVKMAARPFMRPAFDGTRDEVFRTFEGLLWQGIEDLLR